MSGFLMSNTISDFQFQDNVFSTALLPSVEYISLLLKSNSIVFEQHENFIKQTNRSRFHILSANGIQTLHIPVLHNGEKHVKIKDIKIAHSNNWQRQHWRSIESAYNRSPFFEFYKDEFKTHFLSDEELLFNYNMNLLKWIFKSLKHSISLSLTSQFEIEKNPTSTFKSLSNSKTNEVAFPQLFIPKKYNQVFEYKYNFTPNLSVIDLIFNCGNNASTYL